MYLAEVKEASNFSFLSSYVFPNFSEGKGKQYELSLGHSKVIFLFSLQSL